MDSLIKIALGRFFPAGSVLDRIFYLCSLISWEYRFLSPLFRLRTLPENPGLVDHPLHFPAKSGKMAQQASQDSSLEFQGFLVGKMEEVQGDYL